MSRVDKALSEFWYLATTKNLDKGLTKFEKRVAPVEFVFIGTSSFARMPKLTSTYFRLHRCTSLRDARLLAPRPCRGDIQHAHPYP